MVQRISITILNSETEFIQLKLCYVSSKKQTQISSVVGAAVFTWKYCSVERTDSASPRTSIDTRNDQVCNEETKSIIYYQSTVMELAIQ